MSGAVIVRLVGLIFITKFCGSNGNIIDVTKEDIQETQKWWTEYRRMAITPVAVTALVGKLLPVLVETALKDELVDVLTKNNNDTAVNGTQLLLNWIDKLIKDLNDDKEFTKDIEDMKLRHEEKKSSETGKEVALELIKLLTTQLGSKFDGPAQKIVEKTVSAVINAIQKKS